MAWEGLLLASQNPAPRRIQRNSDFQRKSGCVLQRCKPQSRAGQVRAASSAEPGGGRLSCPTVGGGPPTEQMSDPRGACGGRRSTVPRVRSPVSVPKAYQDLTALTLLPRQGLAPAHSGDFGEPLTLFDTRFLHLKNKIGCFFQTFDHTHIKKYISQYTTGAIIHGSHNSSGLTRKVPFSHTCSSRAPGLWVALLYVVIQGPSHLDPEVNVTFNHISKRQSPRRPF